MTSRLFSGKKPRPDDSANEPASKRRKIVVSKPIDIRVSEDSGILLNESGEVYTWGVNVDGVLGHGDTILDIGSNSYESSKRVSNLTQIKAIVAQNSKRYALSRDGKLFAWGNNYENTLGLSESENDEKSDCVGVPKQISSVGNKVERFFITGAVACVITQDREIYTKSINGKNFTRVLSLEEGENIKKILFLGKRFFALTSSGILWTWIESYPEQLTTGEDENRLQACKVENMPLIKDISRQRKEYNSRAVNQLMTLSEEGHLDLWECADVSGSNGVVMTHVELNNPTISVPKTSEEEMEDVFEDMYPTCTFESSARRLSFNLLLSKEGKAYAFMRENMEDKVVEIEGPPIEKVFLSREGAVFALAKSEQDSNQKLLAFGNNKSGRLGLALESEFIEEFKELDFQAEDIKDIKFWGDLTALITKQGKLFVCGNNMVEDFVPDNSSQGKLLVEGFPKNIPDFREIKFSSKVLDLMTTDGQFFVCFSDDPCLRAWGYNGFYNEWDYKGEHEVTDTRNFGALGLPSEVSNSLSKDVANSFLSMSSNMTREDENRSVHGYATLYKSKDSAEGEGLIQKGIDQIDMEIDKVLGM